MSTMIHPPLNRRSLLREPPGRFNLNGGVYIFCTTNSERGSFMWQDRALSSLHSQRCGCDLESKFNELLILEFLTSRLRTSF